MRRVFLPLLVVQALACKPVTTEDVNAVVFHRTCALSSCHGAADVTEMSGLAFGPDVDTIASLVNVPSEGAPGEIRVVPFEPDQSYLIMKLEGHDGITGNAMPPQGSLPQDRIDLVREWIADGALP